MSSSDKSFGVRWMLSGLSTLPNLPILLLSRITTSKVDFLLKKVEFLSKKSRNSTKVEFLIFFFDQKFYFKSRIIFLLK